MKTSIALFATISALAASLPVRPNPTYVYDLATDWSDSNNPNNVWTYRAGSEVLSYDTFASNAAGVPGWVGPDGYLPIWFKYKGADYYDLRTGQIYVHSANFDEEGIANILWEAPSNGTIDISGAAWFGADDCCQGGRSSVWSLWLNGTLLTGGEVASGDVYDFSSPFLFSIGSAGAGVLQNISVSAGTTLMLQIKKESGPYGTFVGVNLTIAFTDNPPDPVSAVEALTAAVVGMNLQNSIANSLDTKLAAALELLSDVNVNNDAASCNSLQAFINSVEAQRAKKITTAQADQLIATAQEIKTLLNCTH
jgi:hypothetical protein